LFVCLFVCLALTQLTDTTKNTKAWALTQRTDTSKENIEMLLCGAELCGGCPSAWRAPFLSKKKSTLQKKKKRRKKGHRSSEDGVCLLMWQGHKKTATHAVRTPVECIC